MKTNTRPNTRITTALLLAAGTGSRLYPLTEKEPKCLTMVGGISILERLISSLKSHGFKRLVVVTGHLENKIKNFLGNKIGHMKVEYIFSPLYKTTNNIYSLWMTRNIIDEPFLIFESDLVFDESLLKNMLHPDRIAVAKLHPPMNGTCVTINESQHVKAFLEGDNKTFSKNKYKTVNMYSISRNSWIGIVKRLKKFISKGKVNEYYESVFAEMVDDGSLSFQSVFFNNKLWYEIDTLEDLAEAEKLFVPNNHIKMNTSSPMKAFKPESLPWNTDERLHVAG